MPEMSMSAPLCLKLLRCHGFSVESKAVPVSSEGLVIGSIQAEGMLYLAPELYVAPRHAEIRQQAGVWELAACDARALCVLNGQKISMDRPQTVIAGDVIEVGFAALGVEATPIEETYFQPLQAGRADIPAVLPADTTFHPLVLPESPPVSSDTIVNDILTTDVENTSLDLLQILAVPACEQTVPVSPVFLDLPAPAPPVSVDTAEALVNLLLHDLGSEAGQALTDNAHPLLPELDNDIPREPQGLPCTLGAFDVSDASGDILQQLARESERNVSGVPSADISDIVSMFADRAASLPTYSAENPLTMLASPEGGTLTDLLEGHLHIDDVLSALGADETPLLLEAEQGQPDPLLLLAGKTAKMSQQALTDILYQDHHTMTLGTPYHQSGKAVSPPIATDRCVRLQEDICLLPPSRKHA